MNELEKSIKEQKIKAKKLILKVYERKLIIE
jgi:hypothetical protein